MDFYFNFHKFLIINIGYDVTFSHAEKVSK